MPAVPCPDCFSGSLTTEVPTGTEETVHGLPVYIARPNGTSKGLIVIIPDAFGWQLPNSRVLADKYAERGQFTVYLPDFMKGNGADPSLMPTFDKIMTPSSWFTTIFLKPLYILRVAVWMVPWFIKCSPPKAKPIVFDFFRALRIDPDTANVKIGAAGFCWGGKFTVQLCQDEPSTRVQRAGSEPGQLQSLIDAGYTAHPSFLKYPADIEAVTKPLCIMVGDKDPQTTLAQAENAKEILEKKNDGDSKVVIIPGAKHGFAVRGLLKDIEQFKIGISAEDEAVSWFGKWLS